MNTDYKKEAWAKSAASLIGRLQRRGMEGRYFATAEEAKQAVLAEIPEGASVAWGGSMTLVDTGILDAVKAAPVTAIDRSLAVTPQEKRECYARAVMADYYLMSTNAITLDGQLVNIDGNGNRVACLITGPSHVILVAGMNKVESTVEAAVARVRNSATPANTLRLSLDTPCASLGHCADCLAPDCICNQIVVTRRSAVAGRIKVFLVGEELGY
ncbi:MAG: lactate utilization protein [Eubacteriales bacterium]|nr:lactate utilization protein [Eubacteriales bacterium]